MQLQILRGGHSPEYPPRPASPWAASLRLRMIHVRRYSDLDRISVSNVQMSPLVQKEGLLPLREANRPPDSGRRLRPSAGITLMAIERNAPIRLCFVGEEGRHEDSGVEWTHRPDHAAATTAGTEASNMPASQPAGHSASQPGSP